MAKIETWFNQDLQQAVKVRYIDGNVFSADNNGNIIGVNVFDNGEPATLSGSVSASIIRSDGATVAAVGTLSGNQISVTLPQSAYSVPGVISIVIKLTSGTDITTLCAVVGNVYQSTTDTVVDPGTIIPDINTLVAEIEAAVATIPSDYSDLSSAVKDILNVSEINIHGVFTQGKSITTQGAITSNSYRIATVDPIDITIAKKIKYSVVSGYRVYMATYNNITATSSDKVSTYGWLTGSDVISLGSTEKYLKICVASVDDVSALVPADAANATIKYTTQYSNDMASGLISRGKINDNTDLDNIVNPGYYNIPNNTTLTHSPSGFGGGSMLEFYTYQGLSTVSPMLLQILIDPSKAEKMWLRHRSSTGSWGEWSTVLSDAFVYNGRVTDGVDLNSVVNPGYYNIFNNTTCTSIPQGFSGGTMLVYYGYSGPSVTNKMVVQVLISPYNKNVWMRYRSSNANWNEWIPLSGVPQISEPTKWLAVGDSITFGVYSYISSLGTRASGVTENCWVKLLSAGMGYELKVMASRGMGYTVTGQDPDGSDLPRINISELLTRIEALTGDYNLITIAFGINDYHTDSSTISAITASLDSAIQRLVTKFPHARIVVITPFNCCRDGDASSNFAYNTQISGRSLKDVAEAIQSRCEAVGVECLFASNGFVFNNYNIEELQADYVHPTLIGHSLIAKTMAHYLLF